MQHPHSLAHLNEVELVHGVVVLVAFLGVSEQQREVCVATYSMLRSWDVQGITIYFD